MKRYGTTKIKIDRDGKRVYGTTNYPDIPLDNADKLYTTTKGERIENIAFISDIAKLENFRDATDVQNKSLQNHINGLGTNCVEPGIRNQYQRWN